MSIAEEIRQASVGMTSPEFLRFLLVDRFPRKTAVTSSLRARSIQGNLLRTCLYRNPLLTGKIQGIFSAE